MYQQFSWKRQKEKNRVHVLKRENFNLSNKEVVYLAFICFSRSWRALIVMLAFFISALIASSSAFKLASRLTEEATGCCWHRLQDELRPDSSGDPERDPLDRLSVSCEDVSLLNLDEDEESAGINRRLGSCCLIFVTADDGVWPFPGVDDAISSPRELTRSDVRILARLPRRTFIFNNKKKYEKFTQPKRWIFVDIARHYQNNNFIALCERHISFSSK